MLTCQRVLRTEDYSKELRMKIIAIWEIAALAIVIGASLLSPLFPVASAANTDVYASLSSSPHFNPQQVWIAVGDTVTWHNLDGFTHTVTSDSGAWPEITIPGGSTGSHTFTALNDYPYHCSIHPSMTGTVHVTTTGVPEFPGFSFVVIGLLAMFLGLTVARRVR